MAHQSELIARDIHAYLKQQEEKGMLRFITCGSVDDGKSTLIGRLLWDSKMIFEDQLTALEADSRRVGTQGQNIDYALLLDGLEAEREQGITIDVAYRFFSTDKRKFIVADTPGHEQYTRNMVTGASNAQVAVILVDARKGVLTQTRRHSYLTSLVGIRHVVLAINKMDLVDYREQRFNEILREYQGFAASLGFEEIRPIPISALNGDNVIAASPATPWYQGPSLMEYLENVQVADNAQGNPFRMRVQWVNRPDLDFRGFCGTIAAGVIHPGDPVVVTSSGQKSRVARIVTMDGDLARAVAGQAVTLTLEDEIDISRGETLAAPQERPHFEDHFEAKLVWLHEEALVPGRDYLLKAGASLSPARIEELRFKVNVNSLQQESGNSLALNEIGVCRLRAAKPVSFDSYRENRATGSFILIDRVTNATVGAGMIHQPLRSSRQGWPEIEINREARAALKNQKAKVLWFDNRLDPQLPSLVEKRLHSLGRHSMPLVSQGAGEESLAETASLLYNAGLIVLVQGGEIGADHLRSRFAPGDFTEIRGAAPENVSDHDNVVTIDNQATPTEQAEHLVRSLDL
ncbi:sulfate adenylyltransferase subunit CysN [Geoalkalibacter subterraneus]|uniref:sulfate adenylyltransferase subunit CysN n=1 Tax=Geoalkalibacter subterraneus TaxID=483547 RepID=UPI0009FFF6F3|nr:sulfate adenylyltransferase subunit CysN [Geoalkalibacter subterraneus]